MCMDNRRRILIVDDSDIDREILKNMLCGEFEVIEADNGYSGLEIILKRSSKIDAILLDIFMPVISGFDILKIISNNKIANIPLILITAEATKENVKRAAQYNVVDFISKPFDPKFILKRLREIFSEYESDEHRSDLEHISFAINNYIEKLMEIYKTYLKNKDINDERDVRVSELMSILLKKYMEINKDSKLDDLRIDCISRAAYFHDIGKMVIPDEFFKRPEQVNNSVYESHTTCGAAIVGLNTLPDCQYFVQICSDICMQHHERFDGKGFPRGLKGDDISFYAQLCRLMIDFDDMLIKKHTENKESFDFIIGDLIIDSGIYSPELINLLKSCKVGIITYYRKKLNKKLI